MQNLYRVKEADLLGKFMTLGADMILKAGGMEPVPPPASLQLGISISLLGKIEPDWIDNPNREPVAIFVRYEEFVSIAQRLKDKLLRGTVVPSSEDEISNLMYSEASA